MFASCGDLVLPQLAGHPVVTYSEDLQVWDVFQQLGDLSESIERQVQGGEPGNHNTSVLKNTKT